MLLIGLLVPCCLAEHEAIVVLVSMFFFVVVLISSGGEQLPGPNDFSPFTLQFLKKLLPIYSFFGFCFGFD